MSKHVAAIASLAAVLITAGCTTAPAPSESEVSAPASKSAAPQAGTPAQSTAPAQPEAPKLVAPDLSAVSGMTPSLLPPKLSPEAAALVERLTNDAGSGALPHELADTTGFPSALGSLEPGAAAPRVESVDATGQPPARGLTADGNTTALVEKDWTGLVLVPIATSLSKAYTSDVRLVKVEAHPLNDGRVRIWTRVHNVGRKDLPAEIACEFRMEGAHASSPYFYQLDVPGNGYRDVFFISPDGSLNAYTVLVRSLEALNMRR